MVLSKCRYTRSCGRARPTSSARMAALSSLFCAVDETAQNNANKSVTIDLINSNQGN